MALASLDSVSYAYAKGSAALREVSLELHEGKVVVLLGPSGSGKSTLLRALAGLVPHFHGGRFRGRVTVDGRDTRSTRPAELAGTVASVFQDPEDQVVMTVVANEVAFGLENIGTEASTIWSRTHEALASVGVAELAGRKVGEVSGGELQRVCLASALALQPRLLLLDEPTSQLDPVAAEEFLRVVAGCGRAVVLSEHRVERALAVADRVVYLEEGRVLLDAPTADARDWLAAERPRWLAGCPAVPGAPTVGDPVVSVRGACFEYRAGAPVLENVSLDVRPGEIVVLHGPNGSGKTTLAKIAAGLLEPVRGTVAKRGRVTYLSQDPGRYLIKETVLEEASFGAGGDQRRGRAALEQFGLGFAVDNHPRDLSSGERERLGLAAVSVSDPDVLVLDEPTRGVDPERKADLAAWIVAEAARGKGMLVATHDRDLPAHRRVLLGRPAEVALAV